MECEGWFDCHSILDKWRNHYSQLFNAIGVSDVRHTEIQTAERAVPEKSAFEVELPIENLKRRKSPGIDQIPAESIKAEGRTIRSEINKIINSIWNKEELFWSRRSRPLKYDETDFSNDRGISLSSIT